MNRPFPIPPSAIKPRGLDFVRAAKALALSDRVSGAISFARAQWGEDSPAVTFLKSAVDAASTTGGGGENLPGNATQPAIEFMEAVRNQTIIGKLDGLRRRPPGVRYLTNQAAMVGSWVADGKPIPILPLNVAQNTLQLLKCAGIIVQTDELLRIADPAAELGLRNDMISGLAEAIDSAFIDPTNAGIAGQEPASVTHGLTPLAIGSGAIDDVRQGIARLIEDFEGNLDQAVFVGSPELFALLNANDFRDIGIRGGTLAGAPAIASKGLPSSGGFYQLALIDPTGIAYADDPAATTVSASRNATVQMLDNPTNDVVTPTATNMVSLFQANAVGLKAVAYVNWNVERSGSVSLMLAFPEAPAS